ncbi:MAG: hypothetical protein KHZ58_08610 [Hungatella hathewayi]|nr:hypothetical protein [Hungatella hathewayi]
MMGTYMLLRLLGVAVIILLFSIFAACYQLSLKALKHLKHDGDSDRAGHRHSV